MLDDFSIDRFHGNLSMIIDILNPIKDFYPKYNEWIEDVVSLGIDDNSRIINVLKNGNDIAGINILKNTKEEKKICSLFISPNYRGELWIYSIFENAVKQLNTCKPVITIPEPIVKKYSGIIFTNKWKLTSKIDGR